MSNQAKIAGSRSSSTADRYSQRSNYTTDIYDLARGRWVEVLTELGVPAKCLQDKHGPCPVCGGKDRFRFDNIDGNGTSFCNQCGAGNGLTLVKRFEGCSHKEAVELVISILKNSSIYPAEKHISHYLRPFIEEANRLAHQQIEADKWLAKKIIHILMHSVDAPADHPYLAEKGICLRNLKVYKSALVVKMYKAHLNLVSLQMINPDEKRILSGTNKKGAYSIVGKHKDTDPIIIAEGFATAVSIYLSTGIAVFIAFDCHNIVHALKTILSNFKYNGTVVIGADHDLNEAGLKGAQVAMDSLESLSVQRGIIIMPDEVDTDWNDVHVRSGIDAVKAAFAGVLS